MSRRGDKLREHILEAAKDVFLEMGFERASMDVVCQPSGNLKAFSVRSFRKQGEAVPCSDRTRAGTDVQPLEDARRILGEAV